MSTQKSGWLNIDDVNISCQGFVLDSKLYSEGLLYAVAEEGFRRFRLAMRDVQTKPSLPDGRSMMRACVTAYASFARDNHECYDLIYGRRSWQSSEHTKSLSDAARSTPRDFIERLERRQTQKLIRQDVDVVQFAQLYWGALVVISRQLRGAQPPMMVNCRYVESR